MSKKDFGRSGKEKLVMYTTTALVIGACFVAGAYVNKLNDIKDDGYIVDLSELDGETQANQGAAENTETNTVNSKSVINDRKDTVEKTLPAAEEKITEQLSVGSGAVDGKAVNEKEVVSKKDTITEEVNTPNTEVMGNLSDEILQFGIEDKMMWPIKGDVIISYSMDKTVYFPTLDQYKYNPAIYVSGKEGDTVSAVAKGRVLEVGENAEVGQYVLMELGDGYEVTYGQLEEINVTNGDIVSKGQVIARLAAPTKYNSAEGPVLYLSVNKDGTSINPLDYLE